MKKTLGQVYFENCRYMDFATWGGIGAHARNEWEKAAAKLAAGFDSVRKTSCNDEQTDDTSGVPLNDYSQY